MSKKNLGVLDLVFKQIYRAMLMSFQYFVNVLALKN